MKKTGFYAGVGINLLFLVLNGNIVVSYLASPTVREAYGYRHVLIYFLFTLFLISALLIAIYFRSMWPKVLFKRLALVLFLFNLGSSFGIDHFLQTDVNKVSVIIRNMAVEPLGNIRIMARNNQKIDIGLLPAGQWKKVFCDCRDVDVYSTDSLGLRLSYQCKHHGEEHTFDLIYPNAPFYDDSLEVRVINDSLVYRSHDYGSVILWEAVGLATGLHPWDTIRKTLSDTPYSKF